MGPILSRRGVLGSAAAFAASAVFARNALAQETLPSLSLPAAPAMPVSLARTLDLRNLHTDETWSGTYHDGTRYIPEAMTALNHLLRDRRSGDVATMDPGVIDILFRIQQRLHEEGQDAGVLGIICGYRSPTTNARMASQDDGVAVHSMHPQAKAIDIQHSVLPARSIQQIALNLQSSEQCGGVGYYPQSNFVHVDTGRVRRWNG